VTDEERFSSAINYVVRFADWPARKVGLCGVRPQTKGGVDTSDLGSTIHNSGVMFETIWGWGRSSVS